MTSSHKSCSSSCSSCTSNDSSFYSSSSAVTSHDGSLALFQQLESEIGNKIHPDIDLATFAREVWGVNEDTVKRILSTPMDLDQTQLDECRRCKEEEDLHKPFATIADHLLTSAATALGEIPHASFPNAFWDRLHYSTANNERQRIPDLVSSPVPHPSNGAAPSLAVANSIAEFKRLFEEAELSPTTELDGPSSSDTSVATTDTTSQCVDGLKGSAASLKRTFDSVKDAEDAQGTAPKKQCQERYQPLRNSLLPLYASETLASSSRYYVVGIIVDRLKVTVCYFDRILVACVTSFSFEEYPAKLALVLYTMSRLDRSHAGFDPHLRASQANGIGEILPVGDIVGSYFEYPIMGNTPTSECFRVTGVIRRPEELLSRATSVYKGQIRLPNNTFTDDEYVHKLSWPLKASTSEIDIVKALKERLPEEAHRHLPELHFTATFTPNDLDLPWLRLGLGLTPENHDDRVLRALTGRAYNRLWEAGAVENFKQAWLDCVECLYLAHRVGKVLHRDLSEDNLMVAKLPDGQVNGVLNDWDMSKFTDDGDDKPYEPGRCTGTPPFMAIELLNQKPMRHYLRHDFESLLYILIWATLHYDLEAGRREQYVHPLIEDWTLDVKSNWQNKAAILNIGSNLALDIFAAAKPAFADVVREWVDPLQRLFTSAHAVHHMRIIKHQASDEETLGGELTFQTVMDAINVTPRTWGIAGYLDD